jgi:HAD superfamily hydrolase (TIGR01509 family)
MAERTVRQHRFNSIVFDFDGVIIDSELISMDALVEEISLLGVVINREEAISLFLGRSWPECESLIGRLTNRPVSKDLYHRWVENILARCHGSLQLVDGVKEFLDAISGMARCVASASSPLWIERWLEHFALKRALGDVVLSARDDLEPKPNPQVFLAAAARLGVVPGSAMVIEDSPVGVEAARRAGMTVVGLCAGSHMKIPASRRLLLQSGPTFVAESYSEILRFLEAPPLTET